MFSLRLPVLPVYSADMNPRAYTPLLLGLIVMAAVFGLPLMLSSPMHHEMGCPFTPAQAAICATSVLEHVKHWQVAFASIFINLLVIASLAFVAARQWNFAHEALQNSAWAKVRDHVPDRPTLLQELYADGILNRKEPYHFS